VTGTPSYAKVGTIVFSISNFIEGIKRGGSTTRLDRLITLIPNCPTVAYDIEPSS